MLKENQYVLLISLASALGGFLFGYDWVVIGGAKPFYEVYLGIQNSVSLQGAAMSSAILGCLIGVMISGSFSDKYGRKPLIKVASLLFIIASFGTGIVNTISWFIIFRIIGGIGIGVASNISPMYIAEVAPTEIRGKFVSINQLTIVLGILTAQVVNWLIAKPILPGENILLSWNGQWGWRWMFWACMVPAIFFFIFSFIIPESPRWLVVKGKEEKAVNIFNRINKKDDYASKQIDEIKQTIVQEKEKIGFSFLFKGKMSKILLVGVIIAILQQWCGINVIFNYAQEIFTGAGYNVSDMLFNIVITGIVNVLFTFVGMYTVDKLGRKSLMLFGLSGLTVIYLFLGIGYYFSLKGIAMLILVIFAIACYAMTLAPVTWVIISEIFPTRVRALGVAIATFALWSACFVLTYTFPILNKGLGSYGTFWLYGLICLFGFFFVKYNLPETKGKSLEQIEKEILNG